MQETQNKKIIDSVIPCYWLVDFHFRGRGHFFLLFSLLGTLTSGFERLDSTDIFPTRIGTFSGVSLQRMPIETIDLHIATGSFTNRVKMLNPKDTRNETLSSEFGLYMDKVQVSTGRPVPSHLLWSLRSSFFFPLEMLCLQIGDREVPYTCSRALLKYSAVLNSFRNRRELYAPFRPCLHNARHKWNKKSCTCANVQGYSWWKEQYKQFVWTVNHRCRIFAVLPDIPAESNLN